MGRKSLDLVGKVGINFKVIEKLPPREAGVVEWSCLCNCGETFIATSKNIARLKNLSCGCASNRTKGPREKLKVGQTFGRLSVIQDEFLYNGRKHVVVSCICGTADRKVRVDSLLSGGTSSCGCLRKENFKTFATKHGKSSTNTYKIYHAMIARCHDSKNDAYESYGAAGIKVCERWLDSYENFLNDMGERPSNEFSLDRIDSRKGYSPENCRWSSASVQAFNQKQSKINTSGRTGVFWYESRKRWVVKLTQDGKEYWFGQYLNFEDACNAVEQAEIKLFGFSRSIYFTGEE